MTPRPHLLLLALPGLWPAGSRAAAPRRPADVAGLYLVEGTARVEGTEVVDREVALRADVTLMPGPPPRGVLARLASQGHTCTLAGELGPGGALTFAPGQRCALSVESDGLRGSFEARLSSARGQVAGGRLALGLSGDLSGAVQLAIPALLLLGVDLAQGWSPELPVRGRVAAEASGRRDESRGGHRSPTPAARKAGSGAQLRQD